LGKAGYRCYKQEPGGVTKGRPKKANIGSRKVGKREGWGEGKTKKQIWGNRKGNKKEPLGGKKVNQQAEGTIQSGW